MTEILKTIFDYDNEIQQDYIFNARKRIKTLKLNITSRQEKIYNLNHEINNLRQELNYYNGVIERADKND